MPQQNKKRTSSSRAIKAQGSNPSSQPKFDKKRGMQCSNSYISNERRSQIDDGNWYKSSKASIPNAVQDNKDVPSMPKVLQVLPALNSGGVERGTLEIAGALVKAGYKAYVCSNGGIMVKELEALGAEHIRLPVHSKSPFRIFMNIFALKKIIEEHGINIIHARSRAPAWSCFFAAKLAKISFITTFHGAYNAASPLKRFYNSIMLKGDKVIAVSNYIKKHIETRYRCVSDNIIVIQRGVDLSYFDPQNVTADRTAAMKKFIGIQLRGKVIVLPARFARWKGHIYLLNALRYLDGIDYTCLLVGDVADKHLEYKHEVERLIQDYNLKKRVHIMPVVSDMPALYSLSDIVVGASQEPEAFGRTITEGQAMRKIVIATNIGAPLETIIDGKTGYLVDYNSPSSLSDILREVISKPENELEKLRDAARAHIKKKFSLTAMCEGTINVYLS